MPWVSTWNNKTNLLDREGRPNLQTLQREPLVETKEGVYVYPDTGAHQVSLVIVVELFRRIIHYFTATWPTHRLWPAKDTAAAEETAAAWLLRALYERVGTAICDDCGRHGTQVRAPQVCHKNCVTKVCDDCYYRCHGHVAIDCSSDWQREARALLYDGVIKIVYRMLRDMSPLLNSSWELILLIARYLLTPLTALGFPRPGTINLPTWGGALGREWDFCPAALTTDLQHWQKRVLAIAPWLFSQPDSESGKRVYANLHGGPIPAALKGKVTTGNLPSSGLWVISAQNLVIVQIKSGNLDRDWARDELRSLLLPVFITRGVRVVGSQRSLQKVRELVEEHLLAEPVRIGSSIPPALGKRPVIPMTLDTHVHRFNAVMDATQQPTLWPHCGERWAFFEKNLRQRLPTTPAQKQLANQPQGGDAAGQQPIMENRPPAVTNAGHGSRPSAVTDADRADPLDEEDESFQREASQGSAKSGERGPADPESRSSTSKSGNTSGTSSSSSSHRARTSSKKRGFGTGRGGLSGRGRGGRGANPTYARMSTNTGRPPKKTNSIVLVGDSSGDDQDMTTS